MFFLAVVLYFIGVGSNGSQNLVNGSLDTRTSPITLNSGDNQCVCQDQRSVFDILWGCLATIFVCSWVSVHPNMPGYNASRTKIVLLRLEHMFWAIIAPEMLILWAMRQWIGARKLAERYREHGWTKTHGYFIQMGGFMLCKNNKPIGILSPDRLNTLYHEGKIDFPTVSEEDIKDRSKADGLSKTLALGQTVWFIIQCIAREAQGLSITELELATVAFAFLNSFMYFFWWNKPLDAQQPVAVPLLEVPRKVEIIGRISLSLEGEQKGIISTYSYYMNWPWQTVMVNDVWALLLIPVQAIKLLVLRIGDLGNYDQRSHTILDHQMQVTAFYAWEIQSDIVFNNVLLATSTIAVLFGGIHCAGWALPFASRTEAIIWRLSSTLITAVPLCMLISRLFRFLHVKTTVSILSRIFKLVWKGTLKLTILSIFFYIIARLALLVEALIGLRRLSAGSLAVVEWTSFIPHI